MSLGELSSQSISWMTNCMAILAFGGGLSNITKRYLQATDKYNTFYRLINKHYKTVFGDLLQYKNGSISLEGSNLPFALPSKHLTPVGQYTLCQPGKIECKKFFKMI
jgi:hypothetical protein